MRRNLEIIDEYSYLMELEKPKTRIIKSEPRKIIQTPIKQEQTKRQPLEINPIYRYTIDGELVDKYINGKQLANKLGWNVSRVNNAANKETLYNGFLLTRTSYTKEQLKERFTIKKNEPTVRKPKAIKTPRPKKETIVNNYIYQYNNDGELVATYDNALDMANKNSLNSNTIRAYSKKETVYNGFLLTRTSYSPQQAKERYTDALNRQQMTYIYKDGELVGTLSTLSKVKDFLNTNETLRHISYHKEKHKPIEGYILSSKPL